MQYLQPRSGFPRKLKLSMASRDLSRQLNLRTRVSIETAFPRPIIQTTFSRILDAGKRGLDSLHSLSHSSRESEVEN